MSCDSATNKSNPRDFDMTFGGCYRMIASIARREVVASYAFPALEVGIGLCNAHALNGT